MSTNTTIKQKLQKLLSAKTSLMTALNLKGANITSSTPLTSYSQAVTNLPTGGGGEGGITFTSNGISVSNTSLSTESPILVADGSFTLTLAAGANINSLTISHAYDMYFGACSSNTLSLYISSGASLTTQTDLSFYQFNSCLIDIQNTSLNKIEMFTHTSIRGGGGDQPGGGGSGSSFANGVSQSFSINISNALINEIDFSNYGTTSSYSSMLDNYGGIGNITILNTTISKFQNSGYPESSTDLTFTSLNVTSSFVNLQTNSNSYSSITILNAQFNNCTSVSIPYVHNTIKLISCTNINNSYTNTQIPGGYDYSNIISGQKSILISGCSNFSAGLRLGNNVSLYNCDFTNQAITIDKCTYLLLQSCVSIGGLICTAYLNLSSNNQSQTLNGINVTGLNMPSNTFVMNVSYSSNGGGGDMSQYISTAAQAFVISIQSTTISSITINNLCASGGGGDYPGGVGVSYYFNSLTLNNVSTTLLELSSCAFNSTIINNTIISNSDGSISTIITPGWNGLSISSSYINNSLILSGSACTPCNISNVAINYFACGFNFGNYAVITILGNYSSGGTQINYGTICDVAYLQGSGFSAGTISCYLYTNNPGGGGDQYSTSCVNLSNVSIGNLIIDGSYYGNSGSASFTSCSIDNFNYYGSTYYQGEMSGWRNITFTDCTFPVSLTSNDYEGLRANIASGNTMYINGNQIVGSSGGGW